MYDDWVAVLLLAVVVLGLIGLMISLYIGRTHQRSSLDDDVPAGVKKRLFLNPIHMLNILFPVIAFVGGALFYYYYFLR